MIDLQIDCFYQYEKTFKVISGIEIRESHILQRYIGLFWVLVT